MKLIKNSILVLSGLLLLASCNGGGNKGISSMTSEATSEATSEITSEVTSEATSEATSEVTSEATSEATSEEETSEATSEEESSDTGDVSSESKSSEESSSHEMPVITDWKDEDYVCERGKFEGFFDEIGFGRFLSTGREFEMSYQSAYSKDPSFTISVSNPDLVEIVHKNPRSAIFTLITKAAGDFILTLEDAQEVLVYRNIVRIRDPFTPEEMPEAVYNIDYFKTPDEWVAYLGEFRLVFTETDPMHGTLSGGDDLEQGVVISFDAEYSEYQDYRDAYLFTCTETSTNASSTDVAAILITRCADLIYVYEKSGLLTYVTAR